MSSSCLTHAQGRKRCRPASWGSSRVWLASGHLTHICLFSLLTYVPQSPWTRVCPSLQEDSGQTQWFPCWPGRTRWTAWFLKETQEVTLEQLRSQADAEVSEGSARVAKHQQALTWYLDRTLEARLDPVDLVVPQHLVQRRPLEEGQHHLWPGILQRQGFSTQTSALTSVKCYQLTCSSHLARHVDGVLQKSLHLVQFLLNVVSLFYFHKP